MSNFVNLLDIVYPVGSIYQSMSATSPVDFIGGIWTKIKTFLYGADAANQTGGEAEHTLTIDEMPSHGHGIVVAVLNGGNAATYVHFLQLILLRGTTVIQIGIMLHGIMGWAST